MFFSFVVCVTIHNDLVFLCVFIVCFQVEGKLHKKQGLSVLFTTVSQKNPLAYSRCSLSVFNLGRWGYFQNVSKKLENEYLRGN